MYIYFLVLVYLLIYLYIYLYLYLYILNSFTGQTDSPIFPRKNQVIHVSNGLKLNHHASIHPVHCGDLFFHTCVAKCRETVLFCRRHGLDNSDCKDSCDLFLDYSTLLIYMTSQTDPAGDMNSCKANQQGRLPGSLNVKPDKMQPAQLIHADNSDMSVEAYLKLTPNVRLECAPDVQVVRMRPKDPGVDNSKLDWKMACDYFEQHPDADIQIAQQDLKDCWNASRPNMDYYTRMTLDKARKHCQKKRQHLQPVQHAPAQQPPIAVSKQDIEVMVAEAVRALLPQQQVQKKKCSECNQEKLVTLFSTMERRKEDGKCLECSPIAECFRKRAKLERECSLCHVVKLKSDYTQTQWDRGSKGKCTCCTSHDKVARAAAGRKLSRTCRQCKEEKSKDAFSECFSVR